MNQDQIAGVVRHVLTALGGVLVTKGYLDNGMLTELVGAVMALGGVAWSFWVKRHPA